MKGLILAGGTGSRLRPITHTGPKQLIPIANKPNILYCVEDLRDAGIHDIGVILGNNYPEQVRQLLGDGSRWGIRLTYVVQGEPRGIAHAIACAEPFLGTDPFVVYLGDNVLKGGVQGLVADFDAHKPDAVIALCHVPNPQQFGVAVLDERGQLLRTVEKPPNPPTNLAVIGIYLFTESIFPIIRALKPSLRNELEVTDAITGLVQQGRTVRTHVVTGWWKDTGRPEDILEVNRLVLEGLELKVEGEVDPSARLEGPVGLGARSRVLAGCVIQGPCIIGSDCVIGPNARIGPYTSIGDRCLLQGANVENSVLFDNVVVKTPRPIVASLIGRHAIMLNGDQERPPGSRFYVGENSALWL